MPEYNGNIINKIIGLKSTQLKSLNIMLSAPPFNENINTKNKNVAILNPKQVANNTLKVFKTIFIKQSLQFYKNYY